MGGVGRGRVIVPALSPPPLTKPLKHTPRLGLIVRMMILLMMITEDFILKSLKNVPISLQKPQMLMMTVTVKVNKSLVKIWLWSPKLKTFILFRKGDFIIMVENVNVTAYDGKNLKDLIQIVFRKKEELDITLAKARWKPTQIDLGGFRNVSEMKKAGLKLELVVTKAPSHGAVDNSQLKDCDVIEKVISIILPK